MKYKVGDRVRIKSLDWYNKNKDSNGNVVVSSIVSRFSWCENVRTVFTKDMTKFCGKVVTIETVWTVNYSIVEGTHRDYFTDEMIEGLAEEETKPNVIEEAKTYWDSIKDAWICPEGYIFKDENGNVINATKIILEKKKKEYPKTFEECVHVLEGENRMSLEQMNTFRKLIDARNAYWKLYGEEMGLGKPWEPDWNDGKLKWCMSYSGNYIEFDQYKSKHHTLAFPTEEMRDAFYENFKELIEMCKELL